MKYMQFIPFGDKNTFDITTTTEKEIQLWQEMSILRHVGDRGIYGKRVTAPYLDQAKIYYLEAKKSNWKSSGLLYYYSFLNIVKAYVVTKRAVSGNSLKSVNIFHGLSSIPQNPNRLIDFCLEIHPPLYRTRKNIFAVFYEKLTNQNWPFKTPITISISDIISYSPEISHELYIFYKFYGECFNLQSLIREDETSLWYELLVPDHSLILMTEYFSSEISSVISADSFTTLDKDIWYSSHKRTPFSLRNHSFVRIGKRELDKDDPNTQFRTFLNEMNDLFKNYIIPLPRNNPSDNSYFTFVPKLNLKGEKLVWHPVLSDYLYAFVLSTVLRYHPHIFNSDNKDSFLAEAWCNQSPETSLRYFLMALTKPSIRIN